MTDLEHLKKLEEKTGMDRLKSVSGQREWRMPAKERLNKTMRSHEKMAQRKEFLEQNPDMKIHIDTSLLKDVVDYETFKCHPDCSVGRNQAVDGSDVDGGIVITKEPVPPEAQQEFVDRLRLMGFSCYTQAEKDGFESEDVSSIEDPEKRELLRTLQIAASNELITFGTTAQVESAIAAATPNAVHMDTTDTFPRLGLDILIAGYDIKDQAPELAQAA